MTNQPPITDDGPVPGAVVVSEPAGPPAGPSLDARYSEQLETNESAPSPPLQSDTPFQARIHQGDHAARRALVASLFYEADEHPLDGHPDDPDPRRKLAWKIVECCRHPVVYARANTKQLFIHKARCKSRCCPNCARLRVDQLKHKMTAQVLTLDDPRFVTLTLRSNDDRLETQVKDLISSFRRLRKCAAWRVKSKGGWYFIEITYNRKYDRWHPHLHVVVDGQYYRQQDLSADWEIASNGSSIVDIRRIGSRKAIANYVTSYVTKSQTPKDVQGPRLVEWAIALNGLRMVQSFGSCHGKKVDHDTTETVEKAEHVTYLGPLTYAAQQGDVRARRLLFVLGHRTQENWDNLDKSEISDRGDKHARLRELIRGWIEQRAPDYHPPPPKRLWEAQQDQGPHMLFPKQPPLIGIA